MPDEIDLLRMFREELPGPSTSAWVHARAAIDAARAEERPGGRSRARRPGRRLLLVAAVAAVAAAAVVGSVLAIRLPGGSGPQVQTAAFVTHVENALTAQRQGKLVEYARTVYPSGGTTDTWAYQGVTKISAFDPDGRHVYDEQVSGPASGRRSREILVDYASATWWRRALGPKEGPAAGSLGCRPGIAGPRAVIADGGWPAIIREALSCGEYRQDGRQRVGGTVAVKLIAGNGDKLWVNPATYLPVRAVLGSPGNQTRTDIRWLRPTSASRAQVQVKVPPGFRHVSPPPGQPRKSGGGNTR